MPEGLAKAQPYLLSGRFLLQPEFVFGEAMELRAVQIRNSDPDWKSAKAVEYLRRMNALRGRGASAAWLKS
jgi:hypothetical protein